MADTRTLEVILKARDEISGVLDSVGENLKKTSKSMTESLNKAIVPSTALAAALAFGAKSVLGASQSLENSLLGLARVSVAMGQSEDDARLAATRLAEDGLMSVSDAAAGLKNLLGTGFKLPEAIQLMNSFRDAAAFNRQGTLSFGEAIVSATQGLKNQNSVLIDNVGITKNLSVMIKDAGLSQEDFMKITDDATVRQKIANQIIKEAAVFSGDAAKMSETYAGKVAELDTQIFMLQAQIGDKLKPAMMEILSAVVGLIDKFSQAVDWMGKNQVAVIVLGGAIAGALVPAMWGFVAASAAAVATLAPFIAAGGVLAALIAGLNWFVETTTGYTLIDQIAASVQLLSTAITDILTKIQQLMDALGKLGKSAIVQGSNTATEGIFQKIDRALGIDKLGKAVRGYADGGFVPSTGLAMVHAGEFVLSRDMLAGRQSVPSNVNTYNSPVTVNATISSPADINVIANRIAWAVRNSR